MTQRGIKALVTWVPTVEGGRSALPMAHQYATVARFREDGARWSEEAWSVVLDFPVTPAEQGSPSVGEVRFLVDGAPHERLHVGNAFELFEGPRRVAYVELIDDQ